MCLLIFIFEKSKIFEIRKKSTGGTKLKNIKIFENLFPENLLIEIQQGLNVEQNINIRTRNTPFGFEIKDLAGI